MLKVSLKGDTLMNSIKKNEEKVKRLAPTQDVLRELYLKSGNQCAFPGCNHLMMDSEGDFIGQICHIEAAEPGGERFNDNQSNEERRAYSNLMLMCHAHHKKTNNTKENTVAVLKKMKKDHESKFADIVSKLQNSISDLTQLQEYSYTKSCKRLSDFFNWKSDKKELKVLSEEINVWVDILRKLPIDTRNIFSIMIHRSTPSRGGERVILHEIEKITGLTGSGVKEHYDLLRKYGLLTEAEEDEEIFTWVVYLTVFKSEWEFWSDLKKFCKAEEIGLEEFVVQLNFERLD